MRQPLRRPESGRSRERRSMDLIAPMDWGLSKVTARQVIARLRRCITAMNLLVKTAGSACRPLRQSTQLMNAGISGNACRNEGFDMMTPSSPEGVDQFGAGCATFENLDTVILALGVNDVVYFTADETSKDYLNQATSCGTTHMTETLHQRGVCAVAQTLSLEKGYPEAGGYAADEETDQ